MSKDRNGNDISVGDTLIVVRKTDGLEVGTIGVVHKEKHPDSNYHVNIFLDKLTGVPNYMLGADGWWFISNCFEIMDDEVYDEEGWE